MYHCENKKTGAWGKAPATLRAVGDLFELHVLTFCIFNFKKELFRWLYITIFFQVY